jgi:acyl dehydratase
MVTGTYVRLAVGDRFTSPAHELDGQAEQMVRWAGYVHPLFSDPGYAETVGFRARLVPGELVLLVLGGLAEQTGVFDETTLALVDFGRVSFKTPASIGDSIRLEMEVAQKSTSASGRRGFMTFNWTCRNQSDEVVLTAEATFAFRTA